MANPTRLKYKFVNDAPREARRKKEVDSLILDFTDRWGDKAVVDLTCLSDRPDLARSVALALFELCEPDGRINRLQTVRTYEQRIKGYLWPFLSDHEAEGHRILRSQDIKTSTLYALIDWLSKKELKRRNTYTIYLDIIRFVDCLRDKHPELIDESLEVPKYPQEGMRDPSIHREAYSTREAIEIERAARKEISETILRLRKGAELLTEGSDPRLNNNWRDIRNLIWYVRNVLSGKFFTRDELRAAGHRQLANAFNDYLPRSKKQVYGFLFPLIADLIPPLILVCLKAGLNPQPAFDLQRNCLKAVPSPGKVAIIATKYRTGGGGPKTITKIVDDRSTLSLGGIIRAFLKLTESCHPHIPIADRSYLWVGLQPRYADGFQRLHNIRLVDIEVKRFAVRNGLTGDDGQPLQLRLARLRTTYLTKRYRAGGNLAAVSRDANHKQGKTTRGYIDNEQTRSIHEQTIADGISDFYNSIRGRILTQHPDDPEQVENAARIVETTIKHAESMLRGEQDTWIATCKDFYNRPGGLSNTPCDRPWACFTCRNAYWTSRTLPRLINFFNFIVEQRGKLSADDWKAKFGLPYEAITIYILPAFPKEVVDQARLTAEAELFILPVNMKVI
jgi:hypothetical protein